MTNSPSGFVGDHGDRRDRLAFCKGAPGGPENLQGVKQTGTRVARLRLWPEYGDVRRLTMRGERRLMLLVARMPPLASSNSRNQRRLFVGLAGGKGPGVGLRTPE